MNSQTHYISQRSTQLYKNISDGTASWSQTDGTASWSRVHGTAYISLKLMA